MQNVRIFIYIELLFMLFYILSVLYFNFPRFLCLSACTVLLNKIDLFYSVTYELLFCISIWRTVVNEKAS